MKRALVTGGAGFLGSHLCARLLAEGYEVVALDNLYTGSKDNLAAFAGNSAFSLVERDVCEAKTDDFGAFDEIYSLACPASPVHYQARPLFTALTSVKGILFCLELARRDGSKLIHASTSEIYGDPLVHPQPESYCGNVNTIGVRSCYDEGKRMAETLVADSIREYGVDVRMVRIFNTYGPRMHPQDGRVISNFAMQALTGRDITVFGDGSQTRSFQYCDDLIEFFRRYAAVGKSGIREFFAARKLGAPVLNAGNPAEFTILELAQKTLAAIPGSKSKIVMRPLPSDDPKKRKPDISLAKELLGWEPEVALDEGLAKTIDYFKTRI
ncbi:MAG: SDR family oxidoreductase [Kiritimatiellae bacterium]|nr:SDR family oxidoreductase [Kiritimatiellia bacterium]